LNRRVLEFRDHSINKKRVQIHQQDKKANRERLYVPLTHEEVQSPKKGAASIDQSRHDTCGDLGADPLSVWVTHHEHTSGDDQRNPDFLEFGGFSPLINPDEHQEKPMDVVEDISLALYRV